MRYPRMRAMAGLFVLGVCLAAWGPKCVRTAVRPGGRMAAIGPAASGADVAGLVDWSVWDGDFRVSNPRVEMRTDHKIAPRPFPVVAFEVEALQDFQGLIYEARFHDADGVGIRTAPTILMFEPDFAVESPFRWKPGVRSHGWFLLPEADVLSRTGRVVVSIFHGY